jgi:hypothetical protein
MASRIVKRLGEAKGTSLIEAAIITPLFFLLTFAIVDFGGCFYAYLALENGVSIATRFAVTGRVKDDPMTGMPLSREESLKLAMREGTPTLTLPDAAFTFEHRAPGAGAWVGGPGGPGDIEKMTVNYTWRFFTPVVAVFFTGGELNMRVESAMKNEKSFT